MSINISNVWPVRMGKVNRLWVTTTASFIGTTFNSCKVTKRLKKDGKIYGPAFSLRAWVLRTSYLVGRPLLKTTEIGFGK